MLRGFFCRWYARRWALLETVGALYRLLLHLSSGHNRCYLDNAIKSCPQLESKTQEHMNRRTFLAAAAEPYGKSWRNAGNSCWW